MIFSPVVGLIHNVKLDRWHPVYFTAYPLSGDHRPSAERYKSGGHHTNGFETFEIGVAEARKLAETLKPEAIGPVALALEKAFPWDGEDIPAMVVFFKVEGETAVPVL